MQTYTPEQLREKMKTLPEDLREAFFSEEVTNVIIKTAKNYGLHVDQYGILGGEVYGIIFGLSHPKDFIINLTNRLGVEKEIAKKIAEDINLQIFQKIRLSLKKIHNITDEAQKALAKPPEIHENKVAQHIKPDEIKMAPKPLPAPPKKEEATQREPRVKELKPLEIRPVPQPIKIGPEPKINYESSAPSTQKEPNMNKTGEEETKEKIFNVMPKITDMETIRQQTEKKEAIKKAEEKRREVKMPTLPKPPTPPASVPHKEDPYREEF
ncbi:hypothetical protein A2Z53_00940 [Candidatus Giovannonibacteria bacterium RIFCSPHIGHO2_02_42_15]|uniref:Uncharacterized protein n=2 Tax=Candidatus Giovannoniibacteriota TaxID=1752738 RepID=A0A1F5VP42_9BACT|nr:MAG: hypothetical protein A2Z53_00940 [Candidatus Giovannonibacteria bacterium RIFCSPHIGHO2_02_42_15]